MAMTRKHFEMIARNIRAQVTTIDQNEHFSDDQRHAVKLVFRTFAENIGMDLHDENSQFDGPRFMKACGF